MVSRLKSKVHSKKHGHDSQRGRHEPHEHHAIDNNHVSDLDLEKLVPALTKPLISSTRKANLGKETLLRFDTFEAVDCEKRCKLDVEGLPGGLPRRCLSVSDNPVAEFGICTKVVEEAWLCSKAMLGTAAKSLIRYCIQSGYPRSKMKVVLWESVHIWKIRVHLRFGVLER